MSVEELSRFQKETLADWCRNPRAWFIMANPVWGRSETVNRIAVFDTKEMAEAYLLASRLPESKDPEIYKTNDGYYRSFRPDSLLWDYNYYEFRQQVHPVLPWEPLNDLKVNPTPPSGPIVNGPKEWSPHGIPNLSDFSTNHPQYGRDFDQGFGGPRTNMDGVVPGEPPAAKPKVGP